MSIIEVTRLRKEYGDQIAVRDVSFAVERGEIFGIVGPNGAGKTTTVECVAGLRAPDSGSIHVLGLDPRHQRDEIRQRLGIQLQESEQPEKLRVDEALQLYSSLYRSPADWRYLADLLGLTAKLRTRYAKLSGGQKQRLSIALALIGNPEIAILDELTTGLDPQARRDTWALVEGIRERGVTIVLVTHFMEEAERLCDRVAVIDAGQVVAIDTPAGLTARIHGEQRMRFRPSKPFEDGLLTDLPEVTDLTRRGDQVHVTGTVDVLAAVIAVLARHGVIAQQLRVDQTSLEDAFVALVGHTADDPDDSSGEDHGTDGAESHRDDNHGDNKDEVCGADDAMVQESADLPGA